MSIEKLQLDGIILSQAFHLFLNSVALLLDSFKCDEMTLFAAFDPIASYLMITAGLSCFVGGGDINEDSDMEGVSPEQDRHVNLLFMDELGELEGDIISDVPVLVVLTELHNGEESLEGSALALDILGLQSVQEPMLSDVGRGEEKLPSEQNDRWH